MNVIYEKDEIKISLSWILDQMTNEQKKELIERLACENDIIDHVASQIVTGYTVNVSSGSRSCGFDTEPHTPLDKARRLVAMSADSVAKSELESAISSMKHLKAWHDHYSDWAFSMYHAWGKQGNCPDRKTPTIDCASLYEVVKKTNLEKQP